MSPYRNSARPPGPSWWHRFTDRVHAFLRAWFWTGVLGAVAIAGVAGLVFSINRGCASQERDRAAECVAACRLVVRGVPIPALSDEWRCVCDSTSGAYTVRGSYEATRVSKGAR